MFQTLPSIFAVAIPIISVVAVFTFVAIAAYSGDRRKEREALYQLEFRKKLIEQGGASAGQVTELLQQEEMAELRRRREGLKVGGFVVTAVGLGLIFGLQWIGEGIWMIGFIPFFIGLALLVYALFFAPREPRRSSLPPAA